ncbi:MAG: ribosome biogenesis GTPase YlqF [Eubacteriales bacterium]|nr:ribosome biogenesis GTPase YlqF [Eubacteriales bacterium]
MDINWYPGHMAKSKNLLIENLKLVDVVIELLDSRIPSSSRNPDFDGILGNKPRIIALNKFDLADEGISRRWSDWFTEKDRKHVFINSIDGTGIKQLKQMIRDSVKDKFELRKQKGLRFMSVKTMVVGIPNVGKSSFINKAVGRSTAKTGDKPGVTRGKQWVRIDRDIDLLDTPGILWPKISDKEVGLHLAFTGAIKDEILDITELAALLMVKLSRLSPDKLSARYKLNGIDSMTGHEMLDAAGRNRGCLVQGGDVNLLRISTIFLDEFRGGKIGRISLETPDNVIKGD